MSPRLAALALALLPACGPEKSGDDTAAVTGTGTSEPGTSEAGTTAEYPTTGTSGEPTTGTSPVDYDMMEMCALAMTCAEYIHGDGEIQGHDPAGFLDEERCILTGLRDGAVGRYVYGVCTVTANGESLLRVQIHVHSDRAVTWVARTAGSFFDGEGDYPFDDHTEAVTCKLVDAPFFDDCFTNHDDYTHYPKCMKPDSWWTGCVAMGPRC